MKKCYQSAQAKRYQAKRSRRQAKARIRAEKPSGRYGQSGYRRTQTQESESEPLVISAPEVFSFVDNPNLTSRFFADLQATYQRAGAGQHIYIDLKSVIAMTPEVIVVLLSRLKDSKFTRDRPTRGNVPDNAKARGILRGSGFYKYVHSKSRKGSSAHGSIHSERNNCVNAKQSAALIDSVAESLPMSIEQEDGLQAVALECMSNTIEHAAKIRSKKEYWWFSVYRDLEEGRAQFALVDNGIGIFASLKRRRPIWWLQLRANVKSGTRADLFEAMMRRQVRSSTGKKYRGRGLPTIAKRNRLKQVRRLVVVTNDVYADIDNASYRVLEHEFRGTIFYWEHRPTPGVESQSGAN